MALAMLSALRGGACAGLQRVPAPAAARSLHASSTQRMKSEYINREEDMPEKNQKYPGAFVEFFPPRSHGQGLRRVQPPDWDGFAYIDQGGWFHEWLVGSSGVSKAQDCHISHYPQSVREYREWNELINEARDRFFGSYPPKGVDEDYWSRLLDHAIKYDSEVVAEDTFRYMQIEYHMTPTFVDVQKKFNEYMSIKRQERWDAW